MEQGDPFQTLQPGKQDQLFIRSVHFVTFQLDEPEKRFPFTLQPKFPEFSR